MAGADPVAAVAANKRRVEGRNLEGNERDVGRVMPAKMGHVLRLGPRAAPKVDMADWTSHRETGGGAADGSGREMEAEGCADRTGRGWTEVKSKAGRKKRDRGEGWSWK